MATIQIDRLLETTVRRKASDLHLAVGKPPTLRLHGHLRELQTKVLEAEDTVALMKSITPERIQQEFEETGSGKTTTLAAMINYINENYDKHIITMEEPIEYYHPHKKSIVVQREVGVDVPNFSEALRRALRQDPDVMLVGEMRDLATISSAITAAETGHLVFGTLHTSGAASTINRVIDVFPKEQQDQIRTMLSTALMGVLSQALLPKKPEGLIAAYEMMVVTPAIA